MAKTSLDMGVGETRLYQVRQGIQRNGCGRRVDDVKLEIQICERRGEEHQARDPGEKMQHRVGVTQPLQHGEAASAERVVEAKYLRHATGPANALPDMSGETLGCETAG